ncbi:MAG TPA: protein kinase [Myxococcales bacterium]|nr:protein kinase [Myxococcales bacterium]
MPAKDPSGAPCPRCARALPPGVAKVCVYCGAALVADPRIGQVVAGRFRIEELIGQGGMGKVYRARQLGLDRAVCLKMLKPSVLEDPTVVGRFEREAMAASRLNHPNSIQVLDFGRNDADGALYLAMEYVQGKDLRAVLRDEWPVPEKRLCHIMAQVLAALGEAHAHNVIHRDLKPENIMVEQRRNQPDFVRVLDFGIARILDSDLPRLTRNDVVCGTPQYMAPEQATGGQLDARCDLYAVGIIFYQLVTGQVPFDGPSSMDVLTRQVHEPPMPPRKRQPKAVISPPLESLILRVLSKNPAQRPQTAEEFRQLVLAIADPASVPPRAQPIPARATPPRPAPVRQDAPRERPAVRTRRVRPLALAAGAAAVIVAGLALLRWSSSVSSAPRVALSSPVPLRNPGEAAEMVRRSVDAETANDLPAARDLLLKAIEADSDNAEAHYRLGALLLGSQPERARSEYKAAKRLDTAKYGEAVDAVLKGL